MFEMSLSSERFDSKSIAVKCIGQLMSGPDYISKDIYDKIPDIHLLLVHNILTLSLDPATLQVTEDSKILTQNKLLVKEALWALSNIAASPPIVNNQLLEESILERVIEIAQRVDGRYHEVFSEAMFVITNLITNSTQSQLLTLLKPNILLMLVRTIDCKITNQRLLTNALESIFRFLKYDKDVGLSGEESIKVCFEANGGYDALNNLLNHPHFEIYSMVSSLIDEFFRDENGEVDYFFSQNYQSNANNIYDDTNHPRSDNEEDDNAKDKFII